MERLKLKYQDANRTLKTLEEILSEPFSIIVRDATIQRFEFTFEAVWKFLKEYLKVNEGIIVNSPKSCFREMFSLGFLSEEDTVKFLDMTDKRNATSHTYKEMVAEMIFNRINEYFLLMKELLSKISKKI
ncbi:MAG: HI0074 family nucleotidyltransferase substrate-binding subunit [Candidatus Hydrogenedentota bacterium]